MLLTFSGSEGKLLIGDQIYRQIQIYCRFGRWVITKAIIVRPIYWYDVTHYYVDNLWLWALEKDRLCRPTL